VGASLTFLANLILARKKVSSDVKIARTAELVGFLAQTLNREAPDHLKDKLTDLRREWAQHIRELYLLNHCCPARAMRHRAVVLIGKDTLAGDISPPGFVGRTG
jgi:hypothetical protein